MFQYALGRRIQVETGSAVKLDTETGFKNDLFGRSFGIGSYSLKLELAEEKDLKQFNFYHSNFAGRVIGKVKKIVIGSRGYLAVENNPFGYEEDIINAKEDMYYDGYWQNRSYFQSIRELLLNDFNFPGINSSKFVPLVREFEENESVAIHVRNPHALTGVKLNEKVYNNFRILDHSYYKKGAIFFKEHLDSPKFYLFCENEEYALPLLKSIKLEQVIRNEDYIDLILMSKCRHQIIANSTFSWWGAWLNENKNKILISPGFWFNNHSINPDSLLTDFLKF